MQLRDRVAIVGGSSQGIGRGIARILAEEGAIVVLTARHEAALSQAAEVMRSETGASILAIPSDVRHVEDAERVVGQTVETFGRVDILVNNDGAPPVGLVSTFDDEAWGKAVEQNLMSVIRMIRLCVPHMKAAGGGCVINIAALSALQPLAGYGLSVATWAGVIGLAKTLSLELGPSGIRINTICPGLIDTPRLQNAIRRATEEGGTRTVGEAVGDTTLEIPLRRLGTPEDIGNMVSFLASDRGSYVTGATIQVDGGLLRSLR